MKKQIVIFLLLVLGASQGYADEASKYIGEWESQEDNRQLTLKNNMHCILKKSNKVILKENMCQWDVKNHTMIYFFEDQRKKPEKIYFKLDNNELIFEEDLRSLTREKADMIMHKI